MNYIVRIGNEDIAVEIDGDVVTVDGEAYRASVDALEGTPVKMLKIGNEVHRVITRRAAGRGAHSIWVDGFRFETEALSERARAIRDASAAAAGPAGPQPLIAPMPGMIVRIAVAVGEAVAAGQGLVVMEAMKMENELRAAGAGVVRAIRAQVGSAVEKGAILLELE